MTTTTGGTFEPGYKAVLVRQETKTRLREFRQSLPDRDLYQERRLATAAVEMILEMAQADEATRIALIGKAREIVKRDLRQCQPGNA